MWKIRHGLIIIIFLLAGFLTFAGKKPDSYTYKALPSKYLPNVATLQYDNKIKALKPYDLTQALPKGYVKNATLDYTAYLQAAINRYNIIRFPDFPILTTGLYLKSNSTVVFPASARLIMKANNSDKYRVLAIRGVENVNVYYPKIEGERNGHIGTSGEWGHGIEITVSKNITIIMPIVKNCWGDGIYIGSKSDSKIPVQGVYENSNINIIGAIIDNNRRNGISIIDGQNINIISPAISNCNGVLPMTGIDIEPNNNKGYLNNILIKDAVTFNCRNVGIDIHLNTFIGALKKTSNITVQGHIDDGSRYGLYIARYKEKAYVKPVALDGQINIINSTWINNQVPFQAMDTKGLAPYINISGAKILVTKNGQLQPLLNTNELIIKNIQNKQKISVN